MLKKLFIVYCLFISSSILASSDNTLSIKGIKTPTLTQVELEASHNYTFPDKLYMGVGIGAGYKNEKEKDILNTNQLLADREYKQTFYGELTSKLGYDFESFILYSSFSVRRLYERSKVQIIRTTFKKKESYLKFAPGGGLDIRVGKNISIGADYKYFIDSKHGKDNDYQLLLKVSYHF